MSEKMKEKIYSIQILKMQGINGNLIHRHNTYKVHYFTILLFCICHSVLKFEKKYNVCLKIKWSEDKNVFKKR